MTPSARTQTEQTAKRDLSGWAMVALTAVIAIGTSYATSQFTAGSLATKAEEHTQQILEQKQQIQDLYKNKVSTREIDLLRDDIKGMRDEMNKKLDKLAEKR